MRLHRSAERRCDERAAGTVSPRSEGTSRSRWRHPEDPDAPSGSRFPRLCHQVSIDLDVGRNGVDDDGFDGWGRRRLPPDEFPSRRQPPALPRPRVLLIHGDRPQRTRECCSASTAWRYVPAVTSGEWGECPDDRVHGGERRDSGVSSRARPGAVAVVEMARRSAVWWAEGVVADFSRMTRCSWVSRFTPISSIAVSVPAARRTPASHRCDRTPRSAATSSLGRPRSYVSTIAWRWSSLMLRSASSTVQFTMSCSAGSATGSSPLSSASRR